MNKRNKNKNVNPRGFWEQNDGNYFVHFALILSQTYVYKCDSINA